MAKNNNWNTADFRRFEFNNFGLSIDPSYTGKDFFDFKAGNQHFKTKAGRLGNSKPRRVG